MDSPKFDSNVGKICRVMKNFGFKELVVINPRAPLGIEAMMYAKHADDILKDVKIVGSFEEAVEGCYPVVGTTASLEKGRRGLVKPVPLSEIKVPDMEKGAIVFGSEDNGLKVEDLKKCDYITFIESTSDYPSLNLSNAVAVVLYMMRIKERESPERVKGDPKAMDKLKELVEKTTENIEGLRNPKKCVRALNNVITRAMPDGEELNSIICIFKGILKEIKK